MSLTRAKRVVKSALISPARCVKRRVKRMLEEFSYPSISVIIPAYNTADYMWQCLSSIVAQLSYKDELIVINDGSTDQTGKVIADSLKGLRNCRVITQSNKGLSAARNTGIKLAKGEYVCFVDSDDWLLPGAFRAWRKAILANDRPDIVYSNRLSFIERTGAYIPNLIYINQAGPVPQIKRAATRIAVHGKVWRRALLLEHKIEFPLGQTFEDNMVAYKTLAFAERGVALRKPTYAYRRRRPDAVSTSVTQQRLNEHNLTSRFKQIESILAFVKEVRLSEKYPHLDWEMIEFDRRLVRHLRVLPDATPEVQEFVLAKVADFLSPHMETVRRVCRPEVVAIYEDIVAGRGGAAISAIDLLPHPDRITGWEA